MPNWSSEDIIKWKKKAKEQQQYFCDRLDDRDYDSYSRNDLNYLDSKIGFALFGPPTNVDENQNNININDYSSENRKIIQMIREKVVMASGNRKNIAAAFIFLFVKQHTKHYSIMLVRALDSNDHAFFIDHFGRIYKCWRDFEVNDEMPKCIYCYPKDGIYSRDSDGDVRLGFGTSAHCNLGERIIKATDITSTVAGISSIAMGVGAFLFPPAAPVLVPAAIAASSGSGAYGIGRASYKLYDRSTHEQSINPFTDLEALTVWLTVAGGALSLGTTGLVSYMSTLARRGDIASKFFRITFTVMESGNLTVNGLGIVCHLIEIIDKAGKKRVSWGDVVTFSASVLFFSHAVINLKTAGTIIKDVQADVLKGYTDGMDPLAKKNFNKVYEATVRDRKMHGNAKVIKGLRKIENPNEFFFYVGVATGDEVNESLNSAVVVGGDVNRNVPAPPQQEPNVVKLTEQGLIDINGEFVVHPKRFAAMKTETQSKILTCTNELKNNPSYGPQFELDMKRICGEERINFEITRKKTLSEMCRRLDVDNMQDFKLNGKHIFENLQPHEIDRLTSVMNNAGANDEILKAAIQFATKVDCKNTSDLCCFVEFVHNFSHEAKRSIQVGSNKEKLEFVVKEMNKPNSSYQSEAIKRFQDIKAEVGPFNRSAQPGFSTDNQATYHFCKHKNFNGRNLSADEYFDMMRELFSKEEMIKVKNMTQEGNRVVITFQDSSSGALGVLIDNIVQSKDYHAIAATFFYEKRIHNSN